MTDLSPNIPVSVDPGDLYEVRRAASAWATNLRDLPYPSGSERAAQCIAQADRIDAAVARLKESE